MSVQAITWAFKKSVQPGPKLLLIALANYADEDGRCFPSKKRLAADCNMSERSIRNHIITLEQEGLISVDERLTPSGRQTSNIICLNFEGENSAPMQVGASPRVQTVAPLMNHHIEPSNSISNSARETPKKPKRVKRAYTLFPDDFVLSEQNYAIALDYGWHPSELPYEIVKMRQWSHDKPGDAGKKSDWQRFALNWLTNGRKPNAARNHPPATAAEQRAAAKAAEHDEIIARVKARHGVDSEPPGHGFGGGSPHGDAGRGESDFIDLPSSDVFEVSGDGDSRLDWETDAKSGQLRF